MTDDNLPQYAPAPRPSEKFIGFASDSIKAGFHEIITDPGSDFANQVWDMVKASTFEEAQHIERWLMEVYGITQEEHDEAGQWVIEGCKGDMPAAVRKTIEPLAIDERFYALARQYDMFSTTHRATQVAHVIHKAVMQGKTQELLEYDDITRRFLDGE